MPRSKSDISNTAIRIFLQDVGKRYDELRELPCYRSTPAQKDEILSYFNQECCYCGVKIDRNKLNQDHLIPTNRQSLGLHAWGNIVPSCRECNSKKQQKDWKEYLKDLCKDQNVMRKRKAKINKFMKEYGYKPNIDLERIAENLYQDVGEVAMTLIRLRFEQAEADLEKLHSN